LFYVIGAGMGFFKGRSHEQKYARDYIYTHEASEQPPPAKRI
jgi:hypothetical protein